MLSHPPNVSVESSLSSYIMIVNNLYSWFISSFGFINSEYEILKNIAYMKNLINTGIVLKNK